MVAVTREIVDSLRFEPGEVDEIEDEIVREELQKPEPDPEPIPPKPIYTDVPIDFTAKIVEVLDFNRVRVDKTYEQ